MKKDGTFIIKLVIPPETENGDKHAAIIHNEDKSIVTELPLVEELYKLMNNASVRFFYAKLVPTPNNRGSYVDIIEEAPKQIW